MDTQLCLNLVPVRPFIYDSILITDKKYQSPKSDYMMVKNLQYRKATSVTTNVLAPVFKYYFSQNTMGTKFEQLSQKKDHFRFTVNCTNTYITSWRVCRNTRLYAVMSALEAVSPFQVFFAQSRAQYPSWKQSSLPWSP